MMFPSTGGIAPLIHDASRVTAMSSTTLPR